MAKKIVFIGSGSLVFTRNLVRDLLTFEAFRDAEITLVDINETNLALSKKAVEGIVTAGKYPAKVTATTNRRDVLAGADGVVTTIAVGSNREFYNDIAIPPNSAFPSMLAIRADPLLFSVSCALCRP